MLVQPQRRAGVILQSRDDGRGVNQGKAKTEVPQDSGKHSQVEPLVVEAPEGGMVTRTCWVPSSLAVDTLTLPLPSGPTEGFSWGMALNSPSWWSFSTQSTGGISLCRAVIAPAMWRRVCMCVCMCVHQDPVYLGTTKALFSAGRFSARSTNGKKQKLQPAALQTQPAASSSWRSRWGGPFQGPHAPQHDFTPLQEADAPKHAHPQLSPAGSPSTAQPRQHEDPSLGMTPVWSSSATSSPQPNAPGTEAQPTPQPAPCSSPVLTAGTPCQAFCQRSWGRSDTRSWSSSRGAPWHSVPWQCPGRCPLWCLCCSAWGCLRDGEEEAAESERGAAA